MRKAILLIAFLLTACVASPPNQTPTQSQFSSGTHTYNPPLIIPSPTSDNGPITPKIINLCPVERVVPLADLGLNAQTRLLMLPADVDLHRPIKTGLWSLSPFEVIPQYISSIIPEEDEMVNDDFQISPDYQWISFLRWKEGDADRALWISSLDGMQQWEVVKIRANSYAQWVSDKEMVIVGITDEERFENIEGRIPFYVYVPLLSINPFTLEAHPLTTLPEERTDRFLIDYFRNMDSSYELYSIGAGPVDKFVLYRYSDDTSQSVFKWLTGKDWVNAITMQIWLLADNTFTVTVTRPYGMDLASGLDLQAITLQQGYDEVMRKIVLPDKMMPFFVLARFPNNAPFLLLEQTTVDYYPPIGFYVLDYQNMIIRDYCFDPSFRGDIIDISPDGHFLATTFYENPLTESGDKWIVVLNLDTGYISYIPDYQFIGWGIDKDDK